MTVWQIVATVIRLAGLTCLLPGMFLAATGVRTIVSGRIDERKKSANALRAGLPLLVIGVVLLFGGTWLANWAVK